MRTAVCLGLILLYAVFAMGKRADREQSEEPEA